MHRVFRRSASPANDPIQQPQRRPFVWRNCGGTGVSMNDFIAVKRPPMLVAYLDRQDIGVVRLALILGHQLPEVSK